MGVSAFLISFIISKKNILTFCWWHFPFSKMWLFICDAWKVSWLSLCFVVLQECSKLQCGQTTKRCHYLLLTKIKQPLLQFNGLLVYPCTCSCTCIPKLDFITKNWSTSFLCNGLMSCGTTFSCTAKPNSKIWACRRDQRKERKKYIFDAFSLSFHHQLGY